MIGNRGLEGDVDARMDAYRGNPQGLMQRYSQSQELIDLLALQKLKSEKEAAARDMQLKMAQQQAAQGQPPTIKDQREKEVMDMTKQELAQQMGGIAQQRQQDQQKKMQQLMQSGLAQIPAPNVARMAGGGIVAFAGEDGSTVGEESEEEKEKRKEAEQRALDRKAMLDTLRKLKAAGMDIGTLPGRAAAGAFESVVTRPLRALGLDIPYLPKDFYGGDASSMTPYMDQLRRDEAAAKTPPDNRALLNQADAALRSAPAPAPAAPSTTAPAPAPALTTPRPAPSAGGAPTQGGIAAVLPPEIAALGKTARDTATTMMKVDPAAAQLAEEKRIEERLKLTPEQRKVYDQGIAQLRQLQEEEYSPEARRERQLSAFLRGAGGRSSFGSVMGGASGSAELERQRASAGRRKGLEDIQKKMEEVIGIERGATKEGIGAGQKTYEQRSLTQRQGLESGAGLYGGELKSRDQALDREIEKRKVEVQSESNAALRDQTNFQRLQGTLQNVNRAIAQTERDYAKIYMPQIDMLKMQLQAKGGRDKALEDQLKQIADEMNAVIDNATADMRRQQSALESAMSGGVDTSGFTVRKKQ